MNNSLLEGLSVLVTRPVETRGELAEMLAALGAETVLFPAIEFRPPEDAESIRKGLINLGKYDFLVFTSPTAVRMTVGLLETLGKEPPAAGGTRVMAVGPKTASTARGAGFTVWLESGTARGKALVEEFAVRTSDEDLKDKTALLPRSDVAMRVVPDGLVELGVRVDDFEAYRTATPEAADPVALEYLDEKGVDVITFASPSAVRGFTELVPAETLEKLKIRARVAVIGPTTEDAAREKGFVPSSVAREHTARGLVEAVLRSR